VEVLRSLCQRIKRPATISFKAALATHTALMSTGELVQINSLNSVGLGGGILV